MSEEVMPIVSIVHNGVNIVYIEGSNEWEFELRGRTRRADSLTKAKEAIDKVPEEKREPFKRFEAFWLGRYGDKPKKVTVTSFAGRGYMKEPEWWVSHEGRGRWADEKKIQREKVSGSALLVICDDTSLKLESIREIEAKIIDLKDKECAIMKSIHRIPEPDKDMES